MSFTIRTVTARAGGGEIVRSRRVDANTARIGRGADCEFHLPDLSVRLHHATASISGGTVLVEAIQGAAFERDGRVATRIQCGLAEKPILLFGSHTLAFVPGEQPGEVSVTLSRAISAGEPADQRRLKRIFSLGPTLFSTRRAAWLLGLAILVACLAVPTGVFFFGWGAAKIRPDQQWSPGPLSAGHRFLASNCQACHQHAFVSVQDNACLTCHQTAHRNELAEIAVRVRALGSSFTPVPALDHAPQARLLRARTEPGGSLQRLGFVLKEAFGHPSLRCEECHTEHVGQQGGPGTPARPAHAQLKAFDCVSCHGDIRARVPDSVVANTPDWVRHPEFRPVLFVSPQGARERESLADISHEYSGLKFSHWQHLHDPAVINEAVKLGSPRYGAPLTCRNCHALAVGGRSFVPIDMPHDCSACHDLKYGVAANGAALVLKHGNPDAVVRQLQIALASTQPSRLTMRRRPGYLGDSYRDPVSGAQGLSSEQASAEIRSVFEKGGLCFGCHTFAQPQGSQSLVYRVLPKQLTFGNVGAVQYFPWSAFDHGIPEHRRDSQGRPTCRNCHQTQGTTVASTMSLPSVRECRACHGAARATTKTAASAECTDCHGYHRLDHPLSSSFDGLHRAGMTAPMQAGRAAGRM